MYWENCGCHKLTDDRVNWYGGKINLFFKFITTSNLHIKPLVRFFVVPTWNFVYSRPLIKTITHLESAHMLQTLILSWTLHLSELSTWHLIPSNTSIQQRLHPDDEHKLATHLYGAATKVRPITRCDRATITN